MVLNSRFGENLNCGLFEITLPNTFMKCHLCECGVPENIHTPPMEGFCFAPLLPPGNSSLASYFASKILTFKTPLPPRNGFFSATTQCITVKLLK